MILPSTLSLLFTVLLLAHVCAETKPPVNGSLASLSKAAERIDKGDAELKKARDKIVAKAEAALKVPRLTVTDKSQMPPSGDRRDYMSLSIYWWPDPSRANGLPYVERDGQRNPEVENYDAPRLAAVARHTHDLGLAWRLTGDARYAARAAEMLRTFFLDDATGMRPHLNFAQGIPGREPGNRQGVIEGVSISRQVLDAVAMIENCPAWTANDAKAFDHWCREFRTWLLHSDLGRAESIRLNNHAVWYDFQVVSLSLFLNEHDAARDWIRQRSVERIPMQIAPGGLQPWELLRTKSWDYSVYNLDAWITLAVIAKRLGVPFEKEGKAQLEEATAYLIEHAQSGEWPHPQILKTNMKQSLVPLLWRGGLVFDRPDWQALALQWHPDLRGSELMLLNLDIDEAGGPDSSVPLAR